MMIYKIYKLKPLDVGKSTISAVLVKLGLKLNSNRFIKLGCMLTDAIIQKYCPKLYGEAEVTCTKIKLYK